MVQTEFAKHFFGEGEQHTDHLRRQLNSMSTKSGARARPAVTSTSGVGLCYIDTNPLQGCETPLYQHGIATHQAEQVPGAPRHNT